MIVLAEKFISGLGEVSLGVSLLLLIIFLLLPLIHKKYRAKWCYWLWLAVAVRLIIPFNISLPNAPVKLYRENAESSLSTPVQETANPFEHEHREEIPRQSLEHTTEESLAEPSAPQDAAEEPVVIPNDGLKVKIGTAGLLTIIWTAGAIVYLGFQLVCYAKFLCYVRRWAAPPKKEATRRIFESCTKEMGAGIRLSLAVCSGIESPMVTGFFQTVLLLPREDYPEEELAMIIRHELVHYKRHDIAYKMLLMFAVAVHWFNPFVWIMSKEANKDLELACDEAATAGMDKQRRAEYGKALISAAASKNFRPAAFTTCFYEKEGTMKKRIKSLFAFGKSRGTAMLCITLAAVLTACTLVACTKDEQPESPSYIEELDGESYDLTKFEEAIGYAVNKSGAIENSQYTARAYNVLYKSEDESSAEAYIYEKLCGFCYINDSLTVCGDEEGFAKLCFKKISAADEKSVYIFDRQEAVDGRNLPPEALNAYNDSIGTELFAEIEKKAAEYDGGRSAAVIFEKPELDYLPISDAAEELLRKANPDYPNWAGSIERISDGATLRFETRWNEKSKGCGTVEFIKTDSAGKELAHIIYSVNGDRAELVSQSAGNESEASHTSSSSAQDTTKTGTDEPKTYKYTYFSNSEKNVPTKPKGVQSESKLATEETYTKWKSFMESYIMSEPKIASFYAWQPNDLKASIEITKDDVKNIIGLLAAAKRSPNSPPAGQNPPTGGGWSIFWEDSVGTQYTASFDGQYLCFANSADGSNISIYTEDDCKIGDYLWALGFSKTHNATAVLKGNSFYRDEKITAIYAIDNENAAFVPVADKDFVCAAVWLNNAVMQGSYYDDSVKSFLIETEGGKYTVWLEDSAPKYVAALWEGTVKNGTKLARWLAYMDPAKVKSIVYEGEIYPENEDGFKNAGWYSEKAVAEYGEETVSAEVLKTAEYLKKNAVIKRAVSTTDGLTQSGMRWTMTINFTTGVSYNLKYCGKSLEVYTSDLDRTIYYEVDTSFGKGVAKLVYSLKTSELNPYVGVE